jgi:hypothetical protein
LTDVHSLRWHDLPFVNRLVGLGIEFDTQFKFTIGTENLRQHMLVTMGEGRTYVLREGDGGGFGMLWQGVNSMHARLAYLSPTFEQGGSEGLWLSLLDGMTLLAGQKGIVTIRAEAPEDWTAFEVLRRADYAVYAHQTIWVRPPAPAVSEMSLRPAHPREVRILGTRYYARGTGLLKMVDSLPEASAQYYVLSDCQEGKGLIGVYRGDKYILADLYVTPEAKGEVNALIRGLLTMSNQGLPVVCRLRHDMKWLGNDLSEAGFDYQCTQAIMLRHTLAGMRQNPFKTAVSQEVLKHPIPSRNVELLPEGFVSMQYGLSYKGIWNSESQTIFPVS